MMLLSFLQSFRTSGLLLLLIASDLDPISGKERVCFERNLMLSAHYWLFELHVFSGFLQDLILPLLPAFSEIFTIPASISVTTDAETLSFESIQLSTQGAERQRKDVRAFVD